MMRPKFMLADETPMMPIDLGWISLSIFPIGRGRRRGAGVPNSQRAAQPPARNRH
jgi:hypothetical protein